MIVRSVAIFLVAAVATVAVSAGDAAKERKSAEKVRAEVARLGTGTDAKISVKLKDGRKLKGHVVGVGDESFTVFDKVTGRAFEVEYSNAKQVKGNNWSTGVIIAVSAAVVVGIIVLIKAYRS